MPALLNITSARIHFARYAALLATTKQNTGVMKAAMCGREIKAAPIIMVKYVTPCDNSGTYFDSLSSFFWPGYVIWVKRGFANETNARRK
jgi:hypothetical protein